MRHYALHLTWRCQNHCTYCWVEQSVRQREEQYHVPTRPLCDWVAAIQRDRVDLAEVLGGEPLLVPWLGDMIAQCPDTRFGISTNGLLSTAAAQLAAQRLPNIVAVNVSLHPETEAHLPSYLERWRDSLLALQKSYRVHVNLVDAPGNRERCALVADWLRSHDVHYAVSPYERVEGLGQLADLGLECQGGIDHLLIAPDGEAWPCFTALRSPYHERYRLGNWLDGPVDVSRKPLPCYLQCVDYYVLPQQHEAGDMWGVRARPAARRPDCPEDGD